MSEKTLEVLNELNKALARLRDCYVWDHYKGGQYQIVGIYFDATNNEVVYAYKRIGGSDFNKILEKDIVFTRSVSEWFSDAIKCDSGGRRTPIRRFVPRMQ